MEYQVGQELELPVVGLQYDVSREREYALVSDGEREYRIYNLLKCQKDSLPEKMYLKVNRIDIFGKISLTQDTGRLNKEHYKKGDLKIFDFVAVKSDPKTGESYYEIEDDFTAHRFYFRGTPDFQAGTSHVLEISSISDKGNVYFKKHESVSLEAFQEEEAKERDKERAKEREGDKTSDGKGEKPRGLREILDIGDECETIEFKSSIAFKAGSDGKEANIDGQLLVIAKVLASFMNTEGGTLYIGVHDRTKRILGLDNDYPHLNEGENDEFNGNYRENHDGYELKIRNAVDRICTSIANSLMRVTFEKQGDAEYCKIAVSKGKRPVWVNGTQLIVRQGNRIKTLRDDAVTLYIYERMEVSIRSIVDTEDMPSMPAASNALDEKKLHELLLNVINQRDGMAPITPPVPNREEVDYLLAWFTDGTWTRIRREEDLPEDKEAYLTLPVRRNASTPVLLFCYENGRVNAVQLSVFRKGANLKKVMPNGWCEGNGAPKSIILAEPSDFLVIENIDFNGIKSVKLHAVTDFNCTKSGKNQGSPVLPEGSSPIGYSRIGAHHRKRVEGLVIGKAQRAIEKGIPLNSPAMKEQIGYLEKCREA